MPAARWTAERVLIVILILVAIFAVVAFLLVFFLGTSEQRTAQAPTFAAWATAETPWPQVRYKAAFGDGVWSAASEWTPPAPPASAPTLSSTATANANPIIVVGNAQYEQVVEFQRQVKQRGSESDAEAWVPVDLIRTGPLSFLDSQRPGGKLEPKPKAPTLDGFANPSLQWCKSFYSVSLANVATWSTWSAPVASQTESYPRLKVQAGFDNRTLVFRRTLDPKEDPVGQIIDLAPTDNPLVFMDVHPPCAVFVLTADNNTFYVALNEGTDAATVIHFQVAPGEYSVDAALSEVASELSSHLGLTTANLLFGKVAIRATLPQPGVNTFTGLTYRVRTLQADTGLSPKASDGATLNNLLGFVPEPEAPACIAGEPCTQIAPAYPRLEIRP